MKTEAEMGVTCHGMPGATGRRKREEFFPSVPGGITALLTPCLAVCL